MPCTRVCHTSTVAVEQNRCLPVRMSAATRTSGHGRDVFHVCNVAINVYFSTEYRIGNAPCHTSRAAPPPDRVSPKGGGYNQDIISLELLLPSQLALFRPFEMLAQAQPETK